VRRVVVDQVDPAEGVPRRLDLALHRHAPVELGPGKVAALPLVLLLIVAQAFVDDFGDFASQKPEPFANLPSALFIIAKYELPKMFLSFV